MIFVYLFVIAALCVFGVILIILSISNDPDVTLHNNYVDNIYNRYKKK